MNEITTISCTIPEKNSIDDDIDKFIDDDNVLFIYEFRSPVVRKFTGVLDSNYVIIYKDWNFCYTFYNNADCFSISSWFKMIENNELITFKCFALRPKYVLKEYISLAVKFDLIKNRIDILQDLNYSWESARYNFNRMHYHDGKIIMYKAFETILFGIQLAINHRIIDIYCADEYYRKIVLNPNNVYDYYYDKYNDKFNKLVEEFKFYSNPQWEEYNKQRIINENIRKQDSQTNDPNAWN